MKSKFGETREAQLKTIQKEIDRLDLTVNPTQTKYTQAHGAPSATWIRETLGLSWRELLVALGYEERPDILRWKKMSDEELTDYLMDFMADRLIASINQYKQTDWQGEAPNAETIVNRFGPNYLAQCLERTFEENGVPSTVVRRQWQYSTDGEVLDHLHFAVEDKKLNTALVYIQNYDKRLMPSYKYLITRFGGARGLYAAYCQRFGREPFMRETSKTLTEGRLYKNL